MNWIAPQETLLQHATTEGISLHQMLEYSYIECPKIHRVGVDFVNLIYTVRLRLSTL